MGKLIPLIAVVLILASCGVTGGKRAAIQAELFEFKDVAEHLGGGEWDHTDVEKYGTRQLEDDLHRLAESAEKISHYGDPTREADVKADQLVQDTVKQLDYLSAAAVSLESSLSTEKTNREFHLKPTWTAAQLAENRKDDREQIQRCREGFRADVAKLIEMYQ